MDPYDSGYAVGQIVGIVCCVAVGLALIGGIIWAIVYFTRKQSKPPAGPHYPPPPPQGPPPPPPPPQ